MQEVLDVARAKDPGESQIGQMTINLQALAQLAAQGEAAANRGGGNRGGPFLSAIVAAVVAVSASVGVPAVTGGDDAAATAAAATATAAVAAESTTHAAQISAADLRLTALEFRASDDERRARRHLAMTVRWLGDSHLKQCLSMQAIAAALKVEIDCTATVRPPELDELVAQLNISESRP